MRWVLAFVLAAAMQVAIAATFADGDFVGYDPAGNYLVEPRALTIVRTGDAGPAHAIYIFVNSAYADANFWLDPTPNDRTDETAPTGRTDFVSIVLHEMGHGLGMAGYRDMYPGPNYGTFWGYATTMDALSTFGGDGIGSL